MDTLEKDRSKSYEKNPSVVCTGLDDGGILLDLDTKYYFALNETGLRIWQLMDECKTPVQIVQKLVNEYEVDEEKAGGSVQVLIQELKKNGLIKSL